MIRENDPFLVSGGGDASDSTESDASATISPSVVMSDSSQPTKGPKAMRHTTEDNKDILYCFLWAKQRARITYSSYSNIMHERWASLRPDKPMSKTALATKGKRLHDRASKDLGMNGWLGLADLKEAAECVRRDLVAEGLESVDADSDIASDGSKDNDMNVGIGGDAHCNDPCGSSYDEGPPASPEYETLYKRAVVVFNDLKESSIEAQDRRVLKKKSFSAQRLVWIDRIFTKICESLSQEEQSNLTIMNTLLYSVAAVFTFKEGQESGCKDEGSHNKGKGSRPVPKWKCRLDKKVMNLRKEVDILQAGLSGRLKKQGAVSFKNMVCRKYGIEGNRTEVVRIIFMLKNRISAAAAKIRRYEDNLKAKDQNELFQKNKKQFYRSVFEQAEPISDPPSEENIRQFWQNEIFGETSLYLETPSWLGEVQKACKGVPPQEWSGISVAEVSYQLAGQMNWKASGMDGLPNFWLKSVPSCHSYLAAGMQCCVENPDQLPEWMVRGRTVLLPKSGNTAVAANYRPITCLNTMWKALTGVLSNKINSHLNKNNILASEQQGAVRNSYGTKRQLLINKSIFEDVFRKKKNLSSVYIDYAKAYDSVPHRWIAEVMSVYKISDVIVNFLIVSMQNWHTDLFLYHDQGVIYVPNIRIKRGIFQGDSLSPLLFIIALNPLSLLINRRCSGYKLNDLNLTHCLYMDDLKGYSDSFKGIEKMIKVIVEFSRDIGMSLGLAKCKVVNLKKGKLAAVGGVTLASGGVIEELGEGEFYKYLGVEELDGTKHQKMKEKVWTGAKLKLRKLLESCLNSKNMFQAINECVIPVVSYSFGIVDWLENDVKEIDVKIRKMLHMYRAFEKKSDVDRLYAARVVGGRGLQSVWDVYKATMCRLAYVLGNSQCEVLQACALIDRKGLFSIQKKAEKFLNGVALELPENFVTKPLLARAQIIAKVIRSDILKKHLDVWKGKPQHGAYLRLLDERELHIKHSVGWMNKVHLDSFSEAYICAAQELALFTRYHERHIIKSRLDDKCRICQKEPETIFHILAGCDILSKREYFTRHNSLCQYVHYEVMKYFALPCGANWYAHSPKEVMMTKSVEIVYDQVISTDRPVGANRPDILVRDKLNRKTYIIDISCPCDVNVVLKEAEKVSKYSLLKNELLKMWGGECVVIPVVIGGLGAVSCNTEKHLMNLPGKIKMSVCQKIVSLGSKKILQAVLAKK